MRKDAFRQFLTTAYRGRKTGKPIGDRPASNAISRCGRVETSLGIDLDNVLREDGLERLHNDMKKRQTALGLTGMAALGLYTLRSAVRLYDDFLKWEREKSN
jgi:hypothetical protein